MARQVRAEQGKAEQAQMVRNERPRPSGALQKKSSEEDISRLWTQRNERQDKADAH